MSRSWTAALSLAAGLLAGRAAVVTAQAPAPAAAATQPAATAPADKGPLPIAVQGDQVLVKRDAANLIDPEKYRVNLSLQPHQVVILSAPYDAIVRQIPEKVNAKLKPQTEVVRLENTVQKLGLQTAQAEFKLASLEQKAAKDEDAKAIAGAKLDAAKARLDLAQFLFDQTSVRTPINGEVRRIYVVEGEFVRAGQPLVEIGDSSRLSVEIPVERHAVTKGNPLTVKIEAAEVQGTVDAILPLNAAFDPLRDLFESIASASVSFDNADGKLFAGQTVYVPLVPRNPIVQVASSAVLNGSDGTRRIQVLRQSVVRDLPVSLMGPVGVDRLYVSGPFTAQDEVIFQTSHQLPDGFQLQPFTGTAASPTAPQPGGNRPAAGTGF